MRGRGGQAGRFPEIGWLDDFKTPWGKAGYPQVFPELIARYAAWTGAAADLPVWRTIWPPLEPHSAAFGLLCAGREGSEKTEMRASYPQIFPVLIARFAVFTGAAGGLLIE